MYSLGRVIDLTIYKSGNRLRMLRADCAYAQSALRMCSFRMPFSYYQYADMIVTVVHIRTTCFGDK